MKKLIDVAAVKEMKAEGKTTVCIDDNTLLTLAARDEISKYGMIIQEGENRVEDKNLIPEPAEVSVAQIFKVLSYLHRTGLLKRQDLLEDMLDSYIAGCKRCHHDQGGEICRL